MNVEIGTEAPIFLFWEYLQCMSTKLYPSHETVPFMKKFFHRKCEMISNIILVFLRNCNYCKKTQLYSVGGIVLEITLLCQQTEFAKNGLFTQDFTNCILLWATGLSW
jgi:hypothetical protein